MSEEDNYWEPPGSDVDNQPPPDDPCRPIFSSRFEPGTATNMSDVNNHWQSSESDEDRQTSPGDPSRNTVSSRSDPVTGDGEFETLNQGQTTDECWQRCQKHTDHGGLIPASDLHEHHLPADYRDYVILNCIKLMSELTVRLQIKAKQSSKTDVECSKEDSNVPAVTRLCTGFFSYFDIRNYVSTFERSGLGGSHTADNEEQSQSFDGIYLDRIREQLMSEMSNEDTREFVRNLGSESLRETCLVLWPHVESLESEIRTQVFFTLLTFQVKQWFESCLWEFDDMVLSGQDVVDHMAISSSMCKGADDSCIRPTSMSDKAPTNIADDTVTNIGDDTVTNIEYDTVTNIEYDTVTNIADDTVTNIADDTVTNIGDDTVTNIEYDTVTNIEYDTVTNIADDTVTNIYDDQTSSILNYSTTNISEGETSNISDDTTTNISDDTTTNISDDETSNISDDTTTNISDDETSNISDDTTTNTPNNTTTTPEHTPSCNSSYIETDIHRVCPCPCPQCTAAPEPQPVGYLFQVLTDRRAVLDNEEAKVSVVDVMSGDEIKHLYGQTVERVSDNCDLQCLECVTHDQDVAFWIKDKCVAFDRVYKTVRSRVARPIAIMCAYPHGHTKMISIGEWTARFSHTCGQTLPLKYVSYTYTTPTCPGCTGAPVLVLGQMADSPNLYNEVQTHFGSLSGDQNKSSIGLAVR